MLEISHADIGDDVVVVTLNGSILRGAESEEIERIVAELLQQGRRKIIFDLSSVRRLDSVGIGRFICSFNEVERAGGRLAMAGATGHVRDVFHVTRLDTIMRFHSDVPAARAAIVG